MRLNTRSPYTTVSALFSIALSLCLGCGATRVPKQFCASDCVEQWEEACATLCGIANPTLDSSSDGDSGVRTGGRRGNISKVPANTDAGEGGSCLGCVAELCDQSTGLCRRCVADEQCTKGPCVDGQCGQCSTTNDCPAGGHCDVPARRCVECLDSGHCQASETARCSEDHRCVPCIEHTDCTDPQAPRCNNGTCEGCVDDSHCVHFDDKKLCDTRGDGACVQCTAADNSACCTRQDGLCCTEGETACQYFVCDVPNGLCTQDLPGTADRCDPCVSDQQCTSGLRCVMQRFANRENTGLVNVGYVCLPQSDPSNGCEESAGFPVLQPLDTISGGTAMVCDLSNATCRAHASFRNTRCELVDGEPDDSICGHPDASDGLCAPFEGDADGSDYRCTMRCEDDGDCPRACIQGLYVCEF